MACLCCDAVGDGLRGVGASGEDTRRPFEAAKRALHVARNLTSRCVMGCVPLIICLIEKKKFTSVPAA
jgi:hypothetical protein